MEPIAVIGGRRSRETNINWDSCFICQTSSHTKESVSKPTDNGLERFKECVAQRQKYLDLEYLSTIDRVRSVDFENEKEHIVWHRTCYSQFTHANHIKRLQKRYQKLHMSSSEEDSCETSPYSSRPSSRSSLSPISWEKCIFCQEEQAGKRLRSVTTFETSEKIIQEAQKDAVLGCRLAGVIDLMAAGGKYHLPCYTAFFRKFKTLAREINPSDICFNNLIKDIKAGLGRGEIYTMATIWEHYCDMLKRNFHDCMEKDQQTSRKAFKLRVKYSLRENAEFVQSMNPNESLLVFPVIGACSVVKDLALVADELKHTEAKTSNETFQKVPPLTKNEKDAELLSWLYRISLKIRSDINAISGHSGIGNISIESAEKVVPASLYLFLSLLSKSDNDSIGDFEENNENNDKRRKILSIGQDIVSLASGGRKHTPKQLGLGLTIHQATRSKNLVQLMHAAGHSVSYEAVRRADTALANAVLSRYAAQNNTIIPLNFTNAPLQGYIRYANDNIDIIEETLDGKGSFHASQTAAFCRGDPRVGTPEICIEYGNNRSVNVPENILEIKPINMGNKNPEAVFPENVKEEWYMQTKQSQEVLSEAMVMDLAWLLVRLSSTEDQHVPSWTAFNQRVSEKNPTKTTIGPMPIINAAAHEFDTIWTVIQNCQKMTAALGQKYTVLTFDEQLYCKAKKLQWYQSEKCKDVVIMLGGFHIQLNFTKVIGHFMADSGLKDILVESGVYGENTAQNILHGKQWNRTIRAHKLVYEALWRILWQKLLYWMHENEIQIDDSITNIAKDISKGFEELDDEAIRSSLHLLIPKVHQVKSLLEDFDKTQENNCTYIFWRKYMHIVSILLRFTRAIRDSNWELYLQSFSEMLPWFAAFDHIHYLRWGSVFLADMKQLQHSAPEVYEGFKSGDFTVKETNKKFNQVSDDQGLEHINKMGKVAGGLVGITRSDTARNRWSLTYIDRARLVDDTRDMFGISRYDDDDSDDAIHKESGKCRIKRDESDVQKLMSMFQRFEVFSKGHEDLVCLTTGDIADVTIKRDVLSAQQVGNQVVQTFVNERLVKKKKSLYESISKLKLRTFSSLWITVVGKEKQQQSTTVIKADRDLFRRLIVVMEAGRDIHIDSVLKQELCHVPLALANTDGTLRASNKSQLFPLLEKGDVSMTRIPVSDTPTCIIVDGMALIQAMGKPKDAKTFGDYAENFIAAIAKYFQRPCTRVDVVFDCYEEYSIKDAARKRRAGKNRGIKCEISNKDLKLPENWKSFIDVKENKVSLSKFLKNELLKLAHNGTEELVVSGGHNGEAVSSKDGKMHHLCSLQEEADSRMILHALEATVKGYDRIIINSSDTDVLLLLIVFHPLMSKEVWMKAGTSQYRRYIPVHKLECPDEIRDSLLAFHAITGCDTTSQFAGISKKSAWKVLCQVPNLLSQFGNDHIPNQQVLEKAEEFVCKLYNPSGNIKEIHQLRCSHFRMGKKNPENIPPTQDALHQHLLRAHYQAFVWKNANIANLDIPSPTTSGWHLKEGKLIPILMTKEPITAECVNIVTCACTSKGRLCQTTQCKCKKNALRCTSACRCIDWCRNPNNEAESD